MKREEKTVQFGNFNVTFEDKNNIEQPMLNYFLDIVYPAFTAGIKRGKKDPVYSFLNVRVREISGELVLIGDFVKDTRYDIYSQIKGNQLESVREEVITAPFSRFMIFLINHRMVLVKNESKSPDLRSFNSTVEFVLHEFVKKENEKIKMENSENMDFLPIPLVHIVGLPKTYDSLEEELSKLKKIKSVTFRLFPLNNDINSLQALDCVRELLMEETDASRASLTLNSPKSSSGVAKVVSESEGLSKINIIGETLEREEVKIKEEDIARTMKLRYDNSLMSYSDERLYNYVKESPVELKTSKENESVYKRLVNFIKEKLSIGVDDE